MPEKPGNSVEFSKSKTEFKTVPIFDLTKTNNKVEINTTGIIQITDINKLPKNTQLWPLGIQQYKLSQGGNRYIFKRDGDVLVFSPQKKGYLKTTKDKVISDINIQKQKQKTNTLQKPNTTPKFKEQDRRAPAINEVSDRDLLAGLRSLIGGPQSKIDTHLRTNNARYESMINTSDFEDLFARARQNPQQNALIIQLYAKYKLGYTRVVVNGKYSEKLHFFLQGLEEQERQVTIDKARAERRATTPELQNKKEEITYKTSKIVSASISPEDNNRYHKIFALPQNTISALLSPRELKKKGPAVEKLKINRQNDMYEKSKRSAIKGCINYLQELFKQNIQVENKQEELSKLFDNLDLNNGIQSHGQSLDFKVVLDGRPLSICYDIATGELRYNPIFMIDKNKGDLLMDKEGREDVLIPGGKMPSLVTMLSDAKNTIIGQASSTPGNWLEIRRSVKNIEQAKPNITANKDIIAKTIAKESCMKMFFDLTGYKLSQDLPKQSYQNSQIYVLYDIMNRTFNNPNMKASDVYKLKYLLQRFVPIIDTYKTASNATPKNNWNNQLSDSNLQQQKTTITGPKVGASVDKSLAFYNLFTQYIDNNQDYTKANYRTLNLQKIEAGLNYYTTHRCLQDTSLVASIEKTEKNNADKELENNFTLWS